MGGTDLKKVFFPILCVFLMLWFLTGCGGTAERESASIPPTQSASDELPTAQVTDPGAADSDPLPSPETTPDPPASSEAVSTPEPTEEVPITPAPVENTPELPVSSEAVTAEPSPGIDYPVTLIYQNPKLPNGCEITSLAILLDWAGFPIDKVELSDNYLPKQGFYRSDGVLHGADPNRAYAGDPASSSSGWYCFEGPILEAGNTYLSDQNSSLRTVALSGLTQEELERCMDAGIPLAVWVTLDYSAPRTRESARWLLPDGTEYVPYRNLHCVVLAGWNGGKYLIANPINGWQTVSPGTFWSCFDAMGRRAVAVLPFEALSS